MAVLRCALAAIVAACVAGLPAAAQTLPAPHAHRTIATAVPAAQAAFDRGLVMLYAFNIGEARAAFRAAELADPQAVLAYFGEAVAETIDINLPSTADGERRGAEAVSRGRLAATPDTPAADRALLDAAARRFDSSHGQKQRFGDYFDALQSYVQTHPDDGMAFTLAAYAGWDATDRLTTEADELTAPAQTMAHDLDAALARDPDDVGAHHLRIHFWEEAHRPDRARADADYLAGLAYDPGQSHLTHMAGHIYDRLGDYAQMIAVNQRACAADAAYFKAGNGDGQKYMRTYHAHDVDFVLYGLTTIGRNREARDFAARDSSYAQEVVALRSHDNRGVLRLLGDAITPMRAIADARAGDLVAARRDLGGASGRPADTDAIVAAAIVARAGHDFESAIAAYRRAQSADGDDLGDPKNHWATPVGEGLGATLLEAHRPSDAERVFRAELVRYPGDPRLEFGLAEAQAAQGEDDVPARAAARAGWEGDRPLTLADLG